MRCSEIVHQIENSPHTGREFIRWWRKENDFADYELISDFIRNAQPEHEIGGYDLLDIEQMWQATLRWVPKGLIRHKTRNGEVIEWTKKGLDGKKHTYICSFSPETLMMIFDEQTRGDVLA